MRGEPSWIKACPDKRDPRELSFHHVKDTKCCQSATQERALTNSTMLAPSFWTSSLQNFEKKNSVIYKPLSLWQFVTASWTSSVQLSISVVSNSCDPMNLSTPGLPVHHQFPESTQTHVHRVGDAIQPSHPLSSRSPATPNPSQQQGLFQWGNSLHEVAKVSEFQLWHQSFQWTPRTDIL